MHFCITGTGRCGTKLMRNLFNTHPELYVFNETHWLPKMFEFYGTDEGSVDSLFDIIHRTYHSNGEPVTALEEAFFENALSGKKSMTIAEFCDVIGHAIAQQNGKKLWADKTPDYGPYLGVLQLLWPKCRVVHMIRHGKEVALSMAGHPGFKWMATAQEMWWTPPSFNHYYQAVEATDRPFAEFIELWYRRLLRIQNEATRLHPGSYLEIRLEDLLEHPEESIRQVATFVGLSSPDEWLKQAVEIIDIDRIHCKASEIPNDEFEPRHRKLLQTLGYNLS